MLALPRARHPGSVQISLAPQLLARRQRRDMLAQRRKNPFPHAFPLEHQQRPINRTSHYNNFHRIAPPN
jgi:hypothetical protein